MPLRSCLAFVASCLLASAASAQDMPLRDILLPGEGWKCVSEGHKFTEGPAVDRDGNLFFVDVPESKIFKLDVASGQVSVFVADSGKASGLMFGGDGRLYACQNGQRAIVAYDAAGKATVIASEVGVNDLVVSKDNHVYWTDPAQKQVWHCDPQGNKRVVDQGIERPNGIILWPDQKTLVVADSFGPQLWAFRIAADGSLQFKQPYYTVQLATGKPQSGSDGMAVDSAGRLYLASHAGLQVFDTQGRLSGVIAKPQDKFLSNVTFAGPQLSTLYVTCTDKVFARAVKATGVRN